MLFGIQTFIVALVACRFGLAEAKYVFAHFLVGNANGNSITEWQDDISLAIDSHIDGFALNVASKDGSNAVSLSNAFAAAGNLAAAGTLGSFKMFFSFDYAAQGPWPAADVIALISQYASNNAYFKYKNQPFVSTFEGPASSGDWVGIKGATGCFFIPDWASIGPGNADGTGVVDGLFNWDAWPVGAMDKTTTSDQAYLSTLGPKSQPYMMSVSPWFFTNLPGYSKNWLWRGDDLWYDRWEQVIQIAPEFVEIITWNDFGESHYIGPLRPDNFGLFSAGQAPFNYAEGMPHDGWRAFLPYVIDTYKTGTVPAVTSEQVVSWYRLNPNTACGAGGTTGNAASQQQIEVPPATLDLDAVFFSALLSSTANVDVTIGTTTQTGSWRNTPAGGSGIYHGSAPFNGATGQVTVTIWRMINGQKTTIAEIVGAPITTACTNNIVNWNAWVGVSNPVAVVAGGPSPAASTTLSIPLPAPATAPITVPTTSSTTTPATSPATTSTTDSTTTSTTTPSTASSPDTSIPTTSSPASSTNTYTTAPATTTTTAPIAASTSTTSSPAPLVASPSSSSSSSSSSSFSSSISSLSTPSTVKHRPQLALDCNHDNCLRQFLRNTAVTSFCATYTTTINTATTSLPWYVAKCDLLPSRISSACSCVVTPTQV